MAPATPTMLPVPTVAARAVHRLWNWEMERSEVCEVTLLSLKIAPMVFFIQWPKWLIWKHLVMQVVSTPTKASRIRAGQPQTMPFRTALILVIMSNIFLFLFPYFDEKRAPSPQRIRRPCRMIGRVYLSSAASVNRRGRISAKPQKNRRQSACILCRGQVFSAQKRSVSGPVGFPVEIAQSTSCIFPDFSI